MTQEILFYQLLNLINKAALYAERDSAKVIVQDEYPEPREVANSVDILLSKQKGKITCLPSVIFNQIIDLAVDLDEFDEFPGSSNSIKEMRAEVDRLNVLFCKYRKALKEIKLNPQADAVAIAKEALKE